MLKKSNFVWAVLDTLTVKLLAILSFLIIGRLVGPEPFGIIALVVVCVNLSEIFINSGLNVALMKKTNRNESDYVAVFVFSLCVALLFYLVIAGFSQYYAEFYNDYRLENVLKVLSLLIVINVLMMVPNIKLQIHMKFRVKAIINVFSSVLSLLVATLLAMNGYDYWSLVVLHLLNATVNCIIVNMYVRWYPNTKFKLSVLLELLGFSMKLLFMNVVNVLYQSASNLILGKFYTVKVVGQYSQANSISSIPISVFQIALQKVTLPKISLAKGCDFQLQEIIKNSCKLIVVFLIPLISMIILFSEDVIGWIMGDEWLVMAMYIKYIALALSPLPILAYNKNLILILGNVNELAIADFVVKIISVFSMIL